MHNDTVNAIAALLTLFSDEEKEGLKITLGERTITLEEQFVGRWCYSKPRYVGQHFLYKAAHIVSGNRLLFYRAIEFQRPEFQARVKALLMNPEAYVRVKTTKTDNVDDTKALIMGQTSAKTANRSSNKSRMGSSESGQEYVELDKVWDREDNDYLTKGLGGQRLGVNVAVDNTKEGLDRLSMGLEVNNPEAINDFENKAIDDTLESHEPALQSISVNQTRSKAINESNSNNIGMTNQHKVLDGRVVATDMSTFEALQFMTSTKLKDPRETAFQKLDVLFTNPCQ